MRLGSRIAVAVAVAVAACYSSDLTPSLGKKRKNPPVEGQDSGRPRHTCLGDPRGCSILHADVITYPVCSVFKDKTIKLWKITERDKRPEGYNLKDEEGKLKDLSTVTSLQVRC